MHPNRLLSVILLNSYPKGQIHRLNVDNNTIVTGRNASGKTTLMGAIAPFYGVLLSSIARKSDVKKSFVDFYLPYNNSYIIYEYQRDERILTVLLRNNNGTPVFHFINGAYKQDDFISKKGDDLYFNSFEQIKDNLRQRYLDITKQLTQQEYEAIISNCPQKLISHYHKDSLKDIQKYRQNFALVSNNKGNFFGFADIIYNVLQSKLEFNEICKFLVDAMQKQGLLQHSTLSLKTQGINTELWSNQRKTWYKIEELAPKFTQLSQLLIQNQAEQKQLSMLLVHIRAFKLQFESSQIQLDEEKSQQQRQLNQLENNLNELERKYIHQNNLLQDKINHLSSKINSLNAQKQDFEQGNHEFKPIAILQDYQAQLPIWERQRRDNQNRQTFLKAELNKIAVEIADINRYFDEQIRQINYRFNQDTQLLTQRKLDINTNYHNEKEKLQQDFYTKIQQMNNHFQKQLDELKEQKANLEEQFAVTKHEQKQTGFSEEINHQLQEVYHKNQAIKLKIKAQNDILKDKKQIINQLQDDIDKNIKECEQCSKQISLIKDGIDNLRALSTGNSLYSFLLDSEAKNPNLSYNIEQIFKTIAPEILKRTDLSPEWLDENQGDYFGLNIQTQRLAMGEQLSLKDIYQKISEEESKIFDLQDELNKLKNKQTQLSKQKQLADDDYLSQEYEKLRLENELIQLEQSEEQIRQLGQKQIRERQKELAVQLEEITQRINSYQQRIDELQHNHHTQKRALEDNKTQEESALKQQLDERKHDLEQREQSLKVNHDNEIKSAELQRDTAIKNKGYDRSELTRLEHEFNELSKKIHLAFDGQKRLKAYHDFLQEEYAKLSDLQMEKQTAQSNQNTNTQTYQTKSDEIKTSIGQANRKINELIQAIDTAKKDQERLNKAILLAEERLDTALLDSLGFNVENSQEHFEKINWHMVAKQLCNQLQQQNQKVSSIVADGKSVLDVIKKPFLTQGGFGDSICDDALARTTETNWHIQAQYFQNYMTNEHEHRKQVIIQAYMTEAEKVNNFKLDLDHVHRALNKFTNQINKSCESICRDLTELAIEEFSMNIHSSITDNEWYPVLNQFSQQYQTWKTRQTNDKSLPDDELFASLDNVQKYIGQNHLNVEYVKQFNIDLIVKQYGQNRQIAKGTQSFKELSSNGTIRIAQLILYLSLFHMMGVAQDVQLKLFIDEIGVLDEENTKELLQILQKNNISAMCAAPEVVHEAVIPLFANNIACRHDKNNVYDFSQIDDVGELAMQSKLENYGCFQ